MVIGFASATEGCSGTIDVVGTYKLALNRLADSAQAKGATGLLFVNFQNRFAAARNCGSNKQAFEVFAWGTAVTWANAND